MLQTNIWSAWWNTWSYTKCFKFVEETLYTNMHIFLDPPKPILFFFQWLPPTTLSNEVVILIVGIIENVVARLFCCCIVYMHTSKEEVSLFVWYHFLESRVKVSLSSLRFLSYIQCSDFCVISWLYLHFSTPTKKE